jgi:hypothetical protein
MMAAVERTYLCFLAGSDPSASLSALTRCGNLSGNVHRSRHALNADTIRAMHAAFRRGGRKAIETVMRNQPAVFLKLLVLLVPREVKMEHSGGVTQSLWPSRRPRAVQAFP